MQPSSDGLFFDRIVKSFGGTQALKGVSLKVARGEIVALLGENGVHAAVAPVQPSRLHPGERVTVLHILRPSFLIPDSMTYPPL